jgi:ubiquinone/menaquinone biosynthesis C-methylase UbiE
MTDEEFWQKNWETVEVPQINEFAKETYQKIKDKNFKTLLEIGAGFGSDAIYFAEQGFDVTAVDYVKSSTDKIKERIKEKEIKNCKVLLKDAKHIDFEDNSFDVIYSHFGLHYFDDKTTTAIFTKLHRILKTKGMIFIKCKSTEDIKFGKGKKVEENTYHYLDRTIHFFDKEYMKEKLKKFKIISIEKRASFYFDYECTFIEGIATK